MAPRRFKSVARLVAQQTGRQILDEIPRRPILSFKHNVLEKGIGPNRSPFEQLPTEILLSILSHLHLVDISLLALTSKYFATFLTTDHILTPTYTPCSPRTIFSLISYHSFSLDSASNPFYFTISTYHGFDVQYRIYLSDEQSLKPRQELFTKARDSSLLRIRNALKHRNPCKTMPFISKNLVFNLCYEMLAAAVLDESFRNLSAQFKSKTGTAAGWFDREVRKIHDILHAKEIEAEKKKTEAWLGTLGMLPVRYHEWAHLDGERREQADQRKWLEGMAGKLRKEW